jgi:phage replication initiation protein
MQKYKIDWLAFTISFEKHVGDKRYDDENILKVLKFDKDDFEEIPGRYFYNSGKTYNQYLNVYWNDPKKEIHRNSSRTMNVQFTGQGCTELVERFNNEPLEVFKAILKYNNEIKFTRIDIALDDNEETVPFSKIENKLKRGHYRSIKKTYNIVSKSNVHQEVKSKTIYIANHRSDNGAKGNVYLRMYDKRAQYADKNLMPPEEYREHWQRYEIVYTKKHAQKLAEKLAKGESVEAIFKQSLRRLLELLVPSKTETNKSRWKVAKFWEKFLEINETYDFSIAERDMTIAQTLEWMRVYVLPTLGLWEEIGKANGFDIYKLLKEAYKPEGFSKKQLRMLDKSKTVDAKTWKKYLRNFKGGYNINE